MGIAQDGSGNIAVQVDGSNNSVTVTCGQTRLMLRQRHKRRRQPRKHLDLLDPYFRAIELIGRGDDLAALKAWLEDPAPINVRCLTGRAGSGKTRLALELCVQAEGLGWLAGFVAHDELGAFQQWQHLAGWRWPQPTLIVVDYAAASARVLRSWLEQLAEHQGEEAPRLRLLLLERHASAEAGWWAELTRFGGFGSAGLADLVDVPVALPSLRTLEQRRHVLGAVMVAASELDGIDPPLRPPAPGADPYFEARLGDDLIDNEPLYLLMAGLTAVRSRVSHVLTNGREDLARMLARAEIERIGRLARDRGLDGRFLQHLAACVTLTDGVALHDCEALALEEQQALQLPPIDGASVAAALAEALQGPTADIVDAIRPDLIGEAAILVAFELARRNPDRQAGIVARAWRRAPGETVATVVRAAQDYAPVDGNHPTLAWLQHLAELTDDPHELTAFADEMPTATTSLRTQAAEIQRRIVEILRTDTAAGEAGLPQLAAALNNLANRLSDLGRREAALHAAEESVQLYWDLAAARPDAFRPNLALALNTLVNMRNKLGQLEPALEAAQAAVAIQFDLVALGADVFRADLAMSLNTLANILSDLGQREPALQAAKDAVALRRELATTRSEVFRGDLALSLNNLANRLSGLALREPAFKAAEEAVQLYRELAAVRPDAFRPNLAMSLNNLANTLSNLGQSKRALQAAEEAVVIRRELAAAQPDAFRPDLALSLNNLANRLSDLELYEPAYKAAEEAVTIQRDLTATRPAAFRPNLAMSLCNLAKTLRNLGWRERALHAAEESVLLYRELAAARPDAFHPNLAVSLAAVANCLESCGRRADALAANREAIMTLAPAFLGLPAAFAHWRQSMVRQYLRCCEASGSGPDEALLESLMPTLKPFMEPPHDGQDEGERG